jgi:predicted ABC-type ATPase
LSACEEKATEINTNHTSEAENEAAFKTILTRHLNAVTDRDTLALKTTLSHNGTMEFIQPKAATRYNVANFMEMQAACFQKSNWSFETKIESMAVSENLGVASTEIIYSESDSDG